jgi:putative membrane-bound dehydrogenase-like protein
MRKPWRAVAAALLVPLSAAIGAAEFKFPTQTITVPSGFEVELVAGPPLVLRPMMADFDELGRLYVADSSGSNDKVDKQLESKPHRIVRLEDTDGDGKFDRSVVFADKLMFPEGVLWYDGAVYTGAPPTIWRLEDIDGDGTADRRLEWHQGKTLTGCANDLHGPYLGPDGWIYWCKGAFAKQTYERPGRRTISDSASHIFRTRPDYTGFESVMAGGMDNPIEVAWSPEGELFFITTFFHHPEAGRRDAIAHCIYGGVYPKPHGVLDNLQKTGDLLPSLVELGPAAACGLTWYGSSAFGPDYESCLFSSLFNLRKVMRHRLSRFCGTYTSVNDDFLVSDNHDFHPTDVMEDADGSLLVIDTGGWYKICCPTSQLAKPDVLGAIYRVRRKGQPKVEDPRGLKLAWSNLDSSGLVALLADARPAVRERALRALAKTGAAAIPALAEAARNGKSIAMRRNAVWALTRIDGAAARDAVRPALDDSDPSVQQTALHSVALHRDAAAFPRLLAFLRAGPAFEQQAAAEALGRIGDPRAVPALLEAAATFRQHPDFQAGAGSAAPAALDDAIRIQEHAIIFALIEISDRQATAAGLQAASPFARRAALIALDQMDQGELQAADVAALLGSADTTLKQTAAWIVDRHPNWGGALSAFFRERLAAPPAAEPERLELERQLARFAHDPAIRDVLARTLGGSGTPAEVRLLTLHAMAGSGLKEVPSAWLDGLGACLADRNENFVRAAVAVLRALPLPKANQAAMAGALLSAGRNSALPLDLRLEALAAAPGGLSEVDAPVLELLLQSLDPARQPAQRSAAANVLARSKLSDPQLIALAEALRTVGPMELNRLLDAFEQASSEAVGARFVASLKESKALASARVDLLRARLAKFPPTVQEAGKELLVLLNVDPAQQAARLDKLLAEMAQQPGDIRRGQLVFNSTKTACSTCHTMGYLGGRVGPDLTSIGQIRTERDLLESVIYPSASFVRSFEPVIITTKDGEDYNGVVRSENDDEIVLVAGASTEQRIARRDVLETRPGTVSIMPQGLDEQLSQQELADLVAFLKGTKWGAQ